MQPNRSGVEHVFAKHLNRPLALMAAADLRMTAANHKAVYMAALAVRCIRPILRWAADLGYAPAGLADIKPPATVQRRKRTLSPDELAMLLPVLQASSRPYAAAMRFMLGTLARREEVCGARWRDIDLEAGAWTLAATKNDEPHTIPLPRQMIALLRSRLPVDDHGNARKPKPDALIFATSTGAPLGNWDRECKKQAELSGLFIFAQTVKPPQIKIAWAKVVVNDVYDDSDTLLVGRFNKELEGIRSAVNAFDSKRMIRIVPPRKIA